MADPAEIEMMRQILAQEAMAPQRMPRPGDPGLPPGGMTVARSGLRSPQVDAIMGALGLPPSVGPAFDAAYGLGEAGPRQVQSAGVALDQAHQDPSIPSVTNAGYQTALAAGRPLVAAGTLGAGLGAGLLDDLGAFGGSEAQAAKLTRDQQRQMEMERLRSEREEKQAKEASERAARQEREKAETTSRLQREEKDAELKRALEGTAATNTRAEYDRAVGTAEEAFKQEMSRDRRFSDKTVGKVWDAAGGLGPAAMGFLGAKLSRLGTGPGETIGGKIVKDYAAPIIGGTTAGAISANLPLAYNALGTEPDNPKKRAYEAKAELLPPEHPRRQEFADYARGLPATNPVRDAARTEFYDPEMLKERLGIGALEGFGGSLFGTDAVSAAGRAYKALRGGGTPGGGTGGPALPNTPPAGGGPQIPLPMGPAPAGPGLPPAGPVAGPSAKISNQELMKALGSPANVNQAAKPRPVKGKDGITRYHDPDSGDFAPKPE